jgi:hypothetical protein
MPMSMPRQVRVVVMFFVFVLSTLCTRLFSRGRLVSASLAEETRFACGAENTGSTCHSAVCDVSLELF